jgi:hypothetical protein
MRLISMVAGAAKPFLALVPNDGHKQDNEAKPVLNAPEASA